MGDFFKGFEQLMELAKELEEKSKKGELKTDFQFSSSRLSSIPPRDRDSPKPSFQSQKNTDAKDKGHFQSASDGDHLDGDHLKDKIGGLSKEINQLKDLV
ncbi:MAG: AAA family ATPase, partial [Ekhidna sp.]|nr:AAA family ATPase [Ekhidna sp.]